MSNHTHMFVDPDYLGTGAIFDHCLVCGAPRKEASASSASRKDTVRRLRPVNEEGRPNRVSRLR